MIIQNENNKTSRIKKLKYGSLSVVFTAAFVGLILAFNLILSTIAPKVNLAVDISKKELYSISQGTKDILESTLHGNFKITIYFLADRDKYDKDQYSMLVRNLGEEYARVYPNNVTVEYNDIEKDPTFAKKIEDETQTTELSNSYIVIKGAYHYRVLNLDAFFQKSSETNSIYAFQGETRFTAAILQCSIENPQVVTFTKGHGEPDIAASDSNVKVLCNILQSAGFELKQTDLSTEDIDARTEILIVNNPRADFIGIENKASNVKNEIDKINEFMTGNKDIMVFVNADTPDLPNLREYLTEKWGLDYKVNHKLSDATHSIESDGFSVVGQYAATSAGSAPNNITSVVSGYKDIKTIFRNAVELENKAINKAEYTVEPVMKTYTTANSVYKDKDNKEESASGEFPLMLLSTYMDYGDNNAVKYKYVLLSSSTDFATDTFMSGSFGNNKIVLGAARIMSTERVAPDIEAKPFTEKAMTIEAGTANSLAWFVSAVFPIIIICVGVVVFIKRRHL